MITVKEHGPAYRVANPARRGEVTTMVNVVFQEEGRSGANPTLGKSADFLSSIAGDATGLPSLRTHTQPVLATSLDKFPVGKQFPGHINRILYSSPQIQQQVDKAPRMVDGKPTYFVTTLDNQAKEDVDNRLPLEVVAHLRPNDFNNALLQTAEVIPISERELDQELAGEEGEQGDEQGQGGGERRGRRGR